MSDVAADEIGDRLLELLTESTPSRGNSMHEVAIKLGCSSDEVHKSLVDLAKRQRIGLRLYGKSFAAWRLPGVAVPASLPQALAPVPEPPREPAKPARAQHPAHRGDEVRQRIQAFIRERLGDRQQVAVSTDAIAQAAGTSRSTAYYHFRQLAAAGVMRARPAGRTGMYVSLVAAGKGKRDQYCPWCGTRTQPAWRFCYSCGGQLPHA